MTALKSGIDGGGQPKNRQTIDLKQVREAPRGDRQASRLSDFRTPHRKPPLG